MAWRLKAVKAATCALALMTATTIFAQAADTLVGMPTVIDGDTIEINGQRIRLHGIDAPESKQFCVFGGKKYRCGQKAALALSDRIGKGTVACKAKDTDRYGRLIAICFKGQEDLNDWLVSEGLAIAYRYYSKDYVTHEARARSISVGLWAGDFIMPWDWRRGNGSLLSRFQRSLAIARSKVTSAVKVCAFITFLVGVGMTGQKLIRQRVERFSALKQVPRGAGWRRSSQ